MHVVKMIVFDIRGRPIQPAARGNRWKWFVDRHITLACMDGSILPRGESFHIRPFHTLRALTRYLEMHKTKPENVVYVSDRLRPLKKAKTKFHFLTISVPPAHARTYTDVSSTSFPNTASLVGLINHLDWRFWPRPKPPTSVSSTPHGSEK